MKKSKESKCKVLEGRGGRRKCNYIVISKNIIFKLTTKASTVAII